jgi:hypothetical protein
MIIFCVFFFVLFNHGWCLWLFFLGHMAWAVVFAVLLAGILGKGKLFVPFVLILAVLPDLDLFIGKYQMWHHTFTHSLFFWFVLFVPFLAVVSSMLFLAVDFPIVPLISHVWGSPRLAVIVFAHLGLTGFLGISALQGIRKL